MTGDEMREAAKEFLRHNKYWSVDRDSKMLEIGMNLAEAILATGQHGKQENCPLCSDSLGEWMECPHCDKSQWIGSAAFDSNQGFWGGEARPCDDCGKKYEILDHGCDGFELRKE